MSVNDRPSVSACLSIAAARQCGKAGKEFWQYRFL
jgi:hypothetical protein